MLSRFIIDGAMYRPSSFLVHEVAFDLRSQPVLFILSVYFEPSLADTYMPSPPEEHIRIS
jgi:hypothetical protein